LRNVLSNPNLHIVFCVTLMAIVSVSSIVPVLPHMATHINGLSKANIGLVTTAFTLPGVLMAPVAGILGDRIGRKNLLVPSLFMFGIFGFGCFFAKDLATLLALRFLQGLGAGPLGMLNLTIIGDLFEGRERLAAMGYNASVLSVGTAAFPALGGLLALVGWNWPFVLPLIALPLGLVVAFRLKTPPLERGESLGLYMRSAARRLRSWPALTLFTVTFLTFVVLYGPIITYLPILLHSRYDASATSIGAIVSISSFITALASSQLGRLSSRFKGSTLMTWAFLSYAVAMVFIPLMPGKWWTILPVLFFGLGQGLNIPTLMTEISSLAPPQQRSAFMATNGMILRLSQTAAPMLMGWCYAVFGINAVYAAGAATAVVMLCMTPLLRRAERVARAEDATGER
jgi:MFS family permease